jgi:HK97 family phage portal protein
MTFFGFQLTRQKALAPRVSAMPTVVPISGGRSLWSSFWIQETSVGGWQRNEDARAATVLANPTLYACVTLIAGDIAKLRPKLVERDANGIWAETDSAAFSPVLRKPNSYQTRIDFYEWWMLSKLAHGNTYALKARDDRGVVVQLTILDPCRVTVLVAPDGAVFYQLAADDLAQSEDVTVPAREIIHDVCCPLFHPLCGVSPIYAAGYPALQGLNIRSSSDKFFSNGSRPGGVLLVPTTISQAAAEKLKEDWETNHSGDNVGKLAVLTGGMTYQPMSVTAEQSQLVEQLGMTDEDIAKCFHMPRHKVGIGPDPTFNNVEALNQQYYADCLQHHIERLEIKLDEGLGLTTVPGRTLGVEFERDDLFQMDTATRVKVAQDALSGGASPNEVRKRWLDLGPVDGGETPFLQEQNWPLQLLADREMPSQRPPTPPAPLPSAPEEKRITLEFRVALSTVFRKQLELEEAA